MKVVIAGGGTGGHFFPALAVGEELARRFPGTEAVYVGSTGGFEARWLAASGHRYRLLGSRGVRGHGFASRLSALGRFVAALGGALCLVRSFRPDVVVSAGGYAAAPVAAAAVLCRRPLVLLEQNTRPGLVNRLLARFASAVCVGFEEAAGAFGRAQVVVTGNPVRFVLNGALAQPAEERPVVLVLGGSSGAHRLNLGVIGALEIIRERAIQWTFLHQAGEADVAVVREAYATLGCQAEVVAFIEEMAQALSRASLVVARAGAMTVSEVALAARPAVFVPYPFHSDRQQEWNARVLERQDAAVIVADDDALADNLARRLTELLEDRARLAAMGARARLTAKPQARSAVARVCARAAGIESVAT